MREFSDRRRKYASGIIQFYLISQAVGFQSQAKLSGKQEVLLTSKLSTAGLWEFEHSDYRVRFDAAGQKVKAGECVLLKHVNTSQWLAVDHFSSLSQMYGKEHEIFVHSYLKQSKSHNLASEQAGRVTIDIPLRGQEDQNAWVVISARSPQEDFDDRVIVQLTDLTIGSTSTGRPHHRRSQGNSSVERFFKSENTESDGVQDRHQTIEDH